MGSRSPNAETSHSSVWLLGLAGTGLSLLVVILILALRNGREQRPSRETVERQRATDGDRSHASNHTANTEGSGATTAVGPENGMAPDDPGQTILSKAAVGPDSVPNPGNPSGTSVADLRLAVEKLKPLLWISAPDRELIPARHSDNDFGRRRTGTFRGLPAFELQDELIDIVIPEKYLRTEFSGWTIVYLASGEGILLSTGDPYLNPGEFFSITAKGHFRVRTGKQQFVHDRRHSSSDLIARVVDYDGKRIRLHTGGDESAEQVFGPTRKRIVKIRLGGRISEDSKRERSDRFRGWLIELVLFDRRLNEEELNRVIRLMQSRVAMSTNQ